MRAGDAFVWDVGALGLDGLHRLAELIALYVQAGDLLLLEGDLGAGKSTLARALIRAIAANEAEEVPSPTFALVQSYETPRLAIHHFDLYRLSGPAEVREIGFAEALDSGLALVEWPDRAEGLLPADHLRISLADAPDPDQRLVKLAGHGSFAGRLAHVERVAGFIEAKGWGAARIAHVAGDASRRSYARLHRSEGGTCLLMDSPPLPPGPPVRDGKPYWAIAHSAPDVRPFITVEAALRGYGYSVPAILARGEATGLLLIEDFGDRTFAAAMDAGTPMRDLYRAATDLLVDLSQHPAPPFLPPFDEGALLIEVSLLIDWYWPHVSGSAAPKQIADEFVALWRRAITPLAAHPREWVLRDVHSPNLLWLPEREGLRKVGLIDFQDAMAGSSAYDLASLLQDARLDVPEALERELLGHYLTQRAARDPSFDQAAFRRLYALMGAQRNTKLLGIFVRLANRDGKTAYLRLLPRIQRYLARNLADPALADLRGWYARHLPA